MSGVNPVLAAALTKSLKIGEISPGSHELDLQVTLRVRGTVVKRPATQYTPTISIPLKATLAVLLQRMGCTREAAQDLLVQVMSEALAVDGAPNKALENSLSDVDAAMARVGELTGSLP